MVMDEMDSLKPAYRLQRGPLYFAKGSQNGVSRPPQIFRSFTDQNKTD